MLIKNIRFILDIFSKLRYNIYIACVAQLVVQLIRNEQVAGSNPVTSSILIYPHGFSLCGFFVLV